MGPYCQFCDHRCFVPRSVPGHPNITILATCAKGMEHDRAKTGYDHTTAINPSDPTSRPTPNLGGCISQTYWYENGAQRARFCPEPATRLLRAADGSKNPACAEHAARMIEAGATEATR